MSAMSGTDGSVSAFLLSRLERVSAVDDSAPAQAAVKAYCDFVDDAIDRRGFADSLFRHTPKLLFATKAEIIHLLNDVNSQKILSALHIAQDPKDQAFWINGLIKAEKVPSQVVQELLARSINDTSQMWGDKIKFRACYRIFPDGYVGKNGRTYKQNKGSAELFKNFGFKYKTKERVTILGNIQDKHLFPSAESDGRSFMVKIVESTDETVRISRELIRQLSIINNGFLGKRKS